MSNYMDGFLVGSILGDNTGAEAAWEARAGREAARAEQAEDQVQKLSVALEKEHGRFLVERRERRNYMRGWAIRGDLLHDLVKEGHITNEEWDVAADILNNKEDAKYLQMRDDKDIEMDREAGF
jgi:hypothetical protein